MMKLKEGSFIRIKKLNHKNKNNKRLIDMGVTPDTIISIYRIAPLGDPYIIKIRNYLLAVRKKDLLQMDLETI